MQEPGTDLAAGVLTSTGGGGGTRTLGRAGGAPKRVASRPVRPPGRQGQQRRRAAPPGGRGEGYKSTPREQAGGGRSAAVAAHGERLLGQVGVGPSIYLSIYLSVFLPVSLSIHPSQPSNHPLNLPHKPCSQAHSRVQHCIIPSFSLYLFLSSFSFSRFPPPLLLSFFSLYFFHFFFSLFPFSSHFFQAGFFQLLAKWLVEWRGLQAGSRAVPQPQQRRRQLLDAAVTFEAPVVAAGWAGKQL